MIFALEIIGTVAFAISGAMVGIRAKMDILGVTVLGLTTAVGGGIVRDVIVGVVPPIAFQKPVYALVAIGVSLIVFIPFVRNHINPSGFVHNLIDAIGLGVFTLVGVRAEQSFEHPFLAVFLGVVTGVGGGVMRDIFAMEKPVIFVKHFYATASIIGAVLCVILLPLNENIAMLSCLVVIIVLRVLAAKFEWHLPKAE